MLRCAEPASEAPLAALYGPTPTASVGSRSGRSTRSALGVTQRHKVRLTQPDPMSTRRELWRRRSGGITMHRRLRGAGGCPAARPRPGGRGTATPRHGRPAAYSAGADRCGRPVRPTRADSASSMVTASSAAPAVSGRVPATICRLSTTRVSHRPGILSASDRPAAAQMLRAVPEGGRSMYKEGQAAGLTPASLAEFSDYQACSTWDTSSSSHNRLTDRYPLRVGGRSRRTEHGETGRAGPVGDQ